MPELLKGLIFMVIFFGGIAAILWGWVNLEFYVKDRYRKAEDGERIWWWIAIAIMTVIGFIFSWIAIIIIAVGVICAYNNAADRHHRRHHDWRDL